MAEKIIRLISAILIFALPCGAKGQEAAIDFFTVGEGGESVECVMVSAGEGQRRPALLVLMGSNPNPVVVTFNGERTVIPLSNFDYNAAVRDYNFVIFPHPHIPASADISTLNDRYRFLPYISKPDSLGEDCLNDNYLGRHVERGKAVLEYLRRQPWIDRSRIVLLGHSQGAHVAARLVFANEDVYALGYFEGSPPGLFSER